MRILSRTRNALATLISLNELSRAIERLDPAEGRDALSTRPRGCASKYFGEEGGEASERKGQGKEALER